MGCVCLCARVYVCVYDTKHALFSACNFCIIECLHVKCTVCMYTCNISYVYSVHVFILHVILTCVDFSLCQQFLLAFLAFSLVQFEK